MSSKASRKYTPERVNTLLEVLEKTGSDKLAYEAIAVSRDTFYRWISQYPDFAEKVEAARSAFLNHSKKVVFDRIQAAEEYIDRVIRGEEFQIKRISETFTLPNGKLGTREKIEEIQIKPHPWMMERILGRIADTTEAEYKLEINLAEPSSDSQEEEEE